jgi:hypothetical protein
VATNPHLATFVYLFAFMLPVGQLFDRVELAAHLEFTVFIGGAAEQVWKSPRQR